MSSTEKIEDIAKRKGFFWPSSEIYGGMSGFYDYGHLGALMKRKWENLWRNYFLSLDDNFYEISPASIMPEGVFVASGHLKSFVDPIVKCKKCGHMERADHILEEELKENFEGVSSEELEKLIKQHGIKCSKCQGHLEEVGTLNMMFPLNVGTTKVTKAYLVPETAQEAFVNFKRQFEVLRKQLPLGLAVIGKAYRNEISPRNLLLRMREFTQAELQIFFDRDNIGEHEEFDEIKDYKLCLFPAANKQTGKVEEVSCWAIIEKMNLPKFYVYHLAKIQQFYLDILKIPKEKFRLRELSEEERAFYNKIHWDIEVELNDLGFKEVGGCHYRTDHDLSGHQKISKQDMTVNIEGKEILAHVLELSFGVDRNIYALLDIAYAEEKERTVLRFPFGAAPYDAAILPLVNKEGMPGLAEKIKDVLKAKGFIVFYDYSGSIGRRYRRMDEIGTPFCITVDTDSLGSKDVTIRDRDSMKQIRVGIEHLPMVLEQLINYRIEFTEAER